MRILHLTLALFVAIGLTNRVHGQTLAWTKDAPKPSDPAKFPKSIFISGTTSNVTQVNIYIWINGTMKPKTPVQTNVDGKGNFEINVSVAQASTEYAIIVEAVSKTGPYWLSGKSKSSSN